MAHLSLSRDRYEKRSYLHYSHAPRLTSPLIRLLCDACRLKSESEREKILHIPAHSTSFRFLLLPHVFPSTFILVLLSFYFSRERTLQYAGNVCSSLAGRHISHISPSISRKGTSPGTSAAHLGRNSLTPLCCRSTCVSSAHSLTRFLYATFHAQRWRYICSLGELVDVTRGRRCSDLCNDIGYQPQQQQQQQQWKCGAPGRRWVFAISAWVLELRSGRSASSGTSAASLPASISKRHENVLGGAATTLFFLKRQHAAGTPSPW